MTKVVPFQRVRKRDAGRILKFRYTPVRFEVIFLLALIAIYCAVVDPQYMLLFSAQILIYFFWRRIRKYISVDTARRTVKISGFFSSELINIAEIRKVEIKEGEELVFIPGAYNQETFSGREGHYEQGHYEQRSWVQLFILVGSEWVTISGISYRTAKNLGQLIQDVRAGVV